MALRPFFHISVDVNYSSFVDVLHDKNLRRLARRLETNAYDLGAELGVHRNTIDAAVRSAKKNLKVYHSSGDVMDKMLRVRSCNARLLNAVLTRCIISCKSHGTLYGSSSRCDGCISVVAAGGRARPAD